MDLKHPLLNGPKRVHGKRMPDVKLPLVKLTAEMIESLQTPKGGYDRATLAKLGVSWPPPKGWKKRLIGKPVIIEKT
ncbi:hypothetical protein [Hymenobacter glacieicola]|uniref:Uncharacterized protein n=1 Tax=Hymenobacter glacieicola TaxID=1562124 RepID=A0ABQ1X6S9_9BACT|nr:hypothetical protein [Hymenobacter glacieicola]GGG61409.1 hypothetical protein GCM10011378_41820 [Hymenobacter glacieicola]